MSKKKEKTEKVESKEKKEVNLKTKLARKMTTKFGDSVLPTTITGVLDTNWLAFNRFCPIELGTSLLMWGASQSGKSLMMMLLGAAVQDKGGLFVCFNTEAANRDEEHLTKVIPNLKYKDILFYQPDYIEQTIDSLHEIVDMTPVKSAPVFISIDSINACATKRELEAEEFNGRDMSGAEIAAIWSQALRQLTNKLSKKPIVLCLVSQTRTGGIGSYATREIPGGGAAPYFYASTVLKTAGKEFLFRTEPDAPYVTRPTHNLQEKSAQECTLKLQKSRYSSGGSTLEYVIDFEKGIHPYEGLVDMLLYHGIISRAGAWYSYDGKQLGQGKQKTKEAVMADPELQKTLIERLNKF